MSSFEDRLWRELASEHRGALAELPLTAVPRRRRTLALPAAAAALALAAALAAALIWLTAGHSQPAYAVTQNPNGTVTVTISQLVGVQGANARLATLGVPVRTVPITPRCMTAAGEYTLAHIARAQMGKIQTLYKGRYGRGLTIAPQAIPEGDTLVLAAREVRPGGVVALQALVYRGAAPSCLRLTGGSR
jgi:hypothetical protein